MPHQQLGVPTPGQVHRQYRVQKQGREHRVVIPVIPVIRVGTQKLARNARVRGEDRRQVCRIPHRQRAQEYGVQQRENGGVGPYPQRQREHRGQGKAAILRQSAYAIAQIIE